MIKLPLQGLIVLEFSQYLSGPSAGLRLADLGARVIKIERPGTGDACRKLAIKNLWVGQDSLVFHTINRNKESYTADLKNAEDVALLKKLIKKADVITHNFRPGVMEKASLGYDQVQQINPSIIYAEISGYGKSGPWKHKPGQDLLVQSLSGLAYTTGNANDAPMPFGLSVVDSICGIHMVQGILGALIRRQKTGKGARVELSLLESAISFQFELFTTHYHSANIIKRSKVNNGNPLLGAPYGLYKTLDGYISLAMMDIELLKKVLNTSALNEFKQSDLFLKRDCIKKIIGDVISISTSEYWIEKFRNYHLWAAKVLDWNRLMNEDAYKILQLEQYLDGGTVVTTRCPIKINGNTILAHKRAPLLGEDTIKIQQEFLMK